MATDIDSGGHVWYECPPGCDRRGCPFCEGCLSLCVICNAAEGELLTCCPGYKLNSDAHEACSSGNVFDFTALHRMRVYNPELFKAVVSRMNADLKRDKLSNEKLR